ncbi:MAG: hypothetical protein H8E62_10700 [Planctomycetes bacterium]|nr:hypothetical protein [Planctomycetota bacterium]
MIVKKYSSRFVNNKLNIASAILTVFLVTIYLLFFSNLNYKAGLVGNPFYVYEILSWFLFLLLILLIVLIIALVNTISVAVKAYKTKHIEWAKLLLAITPLLMLTVFFIPGTSSVEPGAVYFLRGYEKWIEKEVDIEGIRQWLISLPSEYSGKSYYNITDYPKELPEVITKLEPQYMILSEFKDEERCVEFEWGGAFGHWGIRIGLPGMYTPKEEECIKIHESEWEYRRPIEPGVYIFDRG